MARWKKVAAGVGTALLLGGCSFSDDVLWPSLSGEDPAGAQAQTAQAQPAPVVIQSTPVPPTLGTAAYQPVDIAPGTPTGTFVGQRVQELRKDLVGLQSSLEQDTQRLQSQQQQIAAKAAQYHTIVGTMNARLQVGTTPSNPNLVAQWNQAQNLLDQIGREVGDLNALSNNIANYSSVAAYILESTRATYGLGGAVDEDHRQLTILEDEVNRTVVSIDRLLNDLSEDLRRQSNYVSRERSDLTLLSVAVKNGELFGSSLQNRAFLSTAAGAAPAAARPAGPAGARPLVVIRFDTPNVQYEEALYSAMSRAMERRPDSRFEVVAVSSNQGEAGRSALAAATAKGQAEKVLRSLTNMGLSSERIALSATTSPAAETNEVHIYVR